MYTKNDHANDAFKGLSSVNIAGCSAIREFYSPDYSMYDQASKSEDVDYRTTLYWNPNLFTDKRRRRIMLTFYNNDITNKIRVVVEGINMEGKLTRMVKVFE